MDYKIDLNKFGSQSASEMISNMVKKSLMGDSTVIIAISKVEGDNMAVIPKGTPKDVLDLIVIELVHLAKFCRVTNLDGFLESFVEQVKLYFEKNEN